MQHEVFGREHTARVRHKAEQADGLGKFWAGMMLAALAAIDRYRTRADDYGVALMMIREGGADPKSIATGVLSKHGR